MSLSIVGEGGKYKEFHVKIKDSGGGAPRDFAEYELRLSLNMGEENVRNPIGELIIFGGMHRATSQKMSLC